MGWVGEETKNEKEKKGEEGRKRPRIIGEERSGEEPAGHPRRRCRWRSLWGTILMRSPPDFARNPGLETDPQTPWPAGRSAGLGREKT